MSKIGDIGIFKVRKSEFTINLFLVIDNLLTIFLIFNLGRSSKGLGC